MNRLAMLATAVLAASTLAARAQVEHDAPGGLLLTPPSPAPYTEAAPTPAAPAKPPTSIDLPRVIPPASRPAAATPADNGPLLTFRPNQEATVAAMMGSVNEQPIFVTDLLKVLDPQLTRLAQNARTVGEFRQQAKLLIADKLQDIRVDAVILSAAEASLTPDERARLDLLVNAERIGFISKRGGSEAAVEKMLRAQNPPSSLAQWTAEQKVSLKKEIYFSRTIGRNIEVTQNMAREAYLADPKRWQVKAQVQLYQITIPASRWLRETKPTGEVGDIPRTATPEQVKAAEAEAMKVARDIVRQLRAGGDFARLAEEYHSADEYMTNGGKWNKPLEKGALVDTKLETYLFSLPAKSLQDPYLVHNEKFPYSDVVIYKTGEKVEAHTVPFTEAQLQIVSELRQAQIKALQQKKMIELLGEAAYEALDRNIDVAVNAAVTRYATK